MGAAALAALRQWVGAGVRRAALALAAGASSRVRADRSISVPALYAAVSSATRALVLYLWLPGGLLPPLYGDVHIDPGGRAAVRRAAGVARAGSAADRWAAVVADAARRRHTPGRRRVGDWIPWWRRCC